MTIDIFFDILDNGQKIPQTAAVLILLIMLWGFIALVLSYGYTGMLLSNLLLTKRTSVINSLHDIPGSGIRPILKFGSANEMIFKVGIYILFTLLRAYILVHLIFLEIEIWNI